MQPTLVILAAGMASRYGSMKQIQGFGPGGETIMDYSIFDAIRSGFGKVVFIIRREFADDFKEIFEPKLKGKIAIEYAFQDMTGFTEGYAIPEDRKKPWGTAHAVLSAIGVVNEPFAVINADDFYGADAFKNAADFLVNDCTEKNYAIVGYDLLRTLSEHGTVNRGVCGLDDLGNLATITERINIAMKDGKILVDDNLEPRELPLETRVSMNFWCFHPSYFSYTQQLFREFLQAHGQELKSEFFIPIVADRFIKEGGKVEIIPTTSSWFGVTYKEDAPFVEQSLKELIGKGEYPEYLWK
ncbi:MAG: nucleotidyltransferase [Sphingobacteriales bacterium]|nr:nucleotidyltransferase [Sphingobacteriales bacterium]NCT76275.1 nucleotidyltransferase [Chitinophagaceae bacterium]OJW33808.1 MAG: nucleotidyltransferase [Sphingobacteriales bacterium 46-32]